MRQIKMHNFDHSCELIDRRYMDGNVGDYYAAEINYSNLSER